MSYSILVLPNKTRNFNGINLLTRSRLSCYVCAWTVHHWVLNFGESYKKVGMKRSNCCVLEVSWVKCYW